jgi:hypothetical protein
MKQTVITVPTTQERRDNMVIGQNRKRSYGTDHQIVYQDLMRGVIGTVGTVGMPATLVNYPIACIDLLFSTTIYLPPTMERQWS